MPTRRRRWWLWLPVLAVVGLAASHTVWLPQFGYYLIDAQEPAKAEAVVVLAGDPLGNRIREGARLVKEGFAPVAIVSGPPFVYGHNEADLAIEFAMKHGGDPGVLVPVRHEATNTREEAVALCGHLRRAGIKGILLVTNGFHTRRAATTFRQVCSGVDVRAVASPDTGDPFRPETWWRSRRMAKTLFLEWAKTVAYWFGI